MDNAELVEKWQSEIIETCTRRMNRELVSQEKEFITSRQGFLALEAIQDSVKDLSVSELISYLNSST